MVKQDVISDSDIDTNEEPIQQERHLTDEALKQLAKEWMESFDKDGEATYGNRIIDLTIENNVILIDGNDLAKSEKGKQLISKMQERHKFPAVKDAFEQAAMAIREEVSTLLPSITCRFHNMESFRIKLADIGAKYYEKMVSVRGRVVALSRKQPYPLMFHYRCLEKCGHEALLRAHEVGEVIKKPTRCSNCKSRKILVDGIIIDAQIVKITDAKPNQNPTYHNLFLTGEDQCNKVYPGRVIEAFGSVNIDFGKDGKNGLPMFRLDTNNIELYQSELEEFELTSTDIERFDKRNPDAIVNQPGFWDRACKSFAPEVLGMREVKEVLLLMSVSLRLVGLKQTHQLIEELRESTTINALIGGSASVAKSRLLKFLSRAAPNSSYISAVRAYDASMTIFAGKDEYGMFMLQPGEIPKDHLGILCIDEFDKAKDKSLYATLHEPMSDKTITKVAGGITITLPADVSILCGCNSIFPFWNVRKSVPENLAFMPPTLLTRFDVVFAIIDRVDENADYAIAMKVFENNDDLWWQKYMEDNNDLLGFRTMKKYINFINTKIPIPRFPEQLRDHVAKHYVQKRKVEELRGIIVPRYVTNVIRLATMFARFMQKVEVEITDVDKAVMLLEWSYKIAYFDPVTEKLDGAMNVTGIPTRHVEQNLSDMDSIIRAFKTIKSLKNGNDIADTVELKAFMRMPENGGWDEEKTEQVIKKLSGRNGTLYWSNSADGSSGWSLKGEPEKGNF